MHIASDHERKNPFQRLRKCKTIRKLTCMKSKISASLPFSKQIVSKPRCLSELKKFNFICSPIMIPDLSVISDLVGLVMVTDSLELTSMALLFEVFFSLLRRSSDVVTTLEKLLKEESKDIIK